MDEAPSRVGEETIEYHRDASTVRTPFDPEQTSASVAVIETLAAVMDADPIALEPLYSTVDPEALDTLVRVRDGTNGDTRVSFTHEDYAISVHSTGQVTISRGREPPVEDHEGITDR